MPRRTNLIRLITKLIATNSENDLEITPIICRQNFSILLHHYGSTPKYPRAKYPKSQNTRGQNTLEWITILSHRADNFVARFPILSHSVGKIVRWITILSQCQKFWEVNYNFAISILGILGLRVFWPWVFWAWVFWVWVFCPATIIASCISKMLIFGRRNLNDHNFFKKSCVIEKLCNRKVDFMEIRQKIFR